MSLALPDAAATERLAERFASILPEDVAGWTVLLEGELGAGKSTFARSLLRALGHSGPVPSPTYTLVEPYDTRCGKIYHIDLYRIADEDELRYLGWDELDKGLRLIEWPQRVSALESRADIRFSLQYQGDGRQADVVGLSHRGRELVRAMLPTPANPED